MYLLDVEKIEELRKEKRISKTRLGELMAYNSRTSIYHFVKTGVVRNRFKVLALCRILGAEPKDLLLYPKELRPSPILWC